VSAKKNWWESALIYSLYIDKFAGNLTKLTNNLSYFNLLNVNALWLLPHYPSPMVDAGYDVSDYQNVRAELGTLESFELFVKTAHQNNLKIIIDLPLNHTSNQHPWFLEASKNKLSPYRDYYLWSNDQKSYAKAQNPFENIKANNWIFNPDTNDYYFATFYPEQPDLNWDNSKVLEEMVSIINFWINMGIDGFRLDAVARIIKRDKTDCFNLPEVHKVIQKLRKHISKINANVILFAESDLKIPEAKTFFGSGDECQMSLNFELSLALWQKILKVNSKAVEKALSYSYGLPDECTWGTFLDNHDSHALYLLDKKTREKLGKAMDPQNEFSIEIGNKTSTRVANILKSDHTEMIKAYAELLQLPGAHILYYGDELGMLNSITSEKSNDTRHFVRGKFDWEEVKKQIDTKDSFLNHFIELVSKF